MHSIVNHAGYDKAADSCFALFYPEKPRPLGGVKIFGYAMQN